MTSHFQDGAMTSTRRSPLHMHYYAAASTGCPLARRVRVTSRSKYALQFLIHIAHLYRPTCVTYTADDAAFVRNY